MGVPFRIVFYASDSLKAATAAEAAFQRIRQLNDIMTDYEMDSELSRLSLSSDQADLVRVSPDLWLILQRAQALAERTGGAFDVTVGPFVNLWRRARRLQQLPDPELLEAARAAVGYKKVRLYPENQAVQLLVPGMRLDLGGIAKGYASDEALKVLRTFGITHALVAADGDIAVADPPPGRAGWRIAIASLDVENAPTNQMLVLKHAAVSTSGDLSQRLEIEGRRYSHVLDPRTGIGLIDHSLVTVIAPDGITADSLTKAVSVLGPKDGLRLIESTPGTAARVVRKPNDQIEIYESSRFRHRAGHGKFP
jgi:thiamine biosynthesis lipoprotein